MRSLKEISEDASLGAEQLKTIEEIILQHGEYTKETVREEIDWFFTRLGMAEYYFRTTPLEEIATHIEAIKAAEITAKVRKDGDLIIDLVTESKHEALYLVDDDHPRAIEVERRIEKKYPGYRVQSYRTSGKAGREHLRMYLVYQPTLSKRKLKPGETRLEKIACKEFLDNTTKETFARYQGALDRARDYQTPLIEETEKKETGEHRIMIIVDRGSCFRFFSNISDVINSRGLVSNRKYIEHFANGKTAFVFYLDRIENRKRLQELIEDISLVYVISDSPLSRLFRQGELSAQEMVFGVSAWSFAHHCREEIGWETPLDEPARRRLGRIPRAADGRTDMETALAAVGDSLARRSADPKILFVISDGCPDDATATALEIANLEEAGIVPIGLGLGPGTAGLSLLFSASETEIPAERIVESVARLLSETLLAQA